MALVLGTNCGFVTEAPVDDPEASSTTVDDSATVCGDTSPATAAKIIEIGWWRDSNSTGGNVNFEVGLYAADGAVVPGEAGTLLHVERTNASGDTEGWKSVEVDWAISPNTNYWIGVQIDEFTEITTTKTDYINTAGGGYDWVGPDTTTLPNPYGGGTYFSPRMFAYYVVWEAGAEEGTNSQINIGDTFKAIPAMQVNIGDVWKAGAAAQINIGDTWKTIY